MKFKILKGSPLFIQLTEVFDQINEANKAARDLMTVLGFSEWYPAMFVIAGGVSAVECKTGQPEGYKRMWPRERDHAYYPKKTNKALTAQFEALPTVPFSAINNPLKYDPHDNDMPNPRGFGRSVRYTPRVSQVEKQMILVDFGEYCRSYKPVEGMVEITVSEYNKLLKSNEKNRTDSK